MKGDTVLDLVVFELTAPRTRCELFVSANGMTEKLASGFLKPFLNHLRAVEEQVARGGESVKFECPQTYHGRSWFTKGTLERFVRFVSTPEILERVKSIEDELVQLEQVRSIQGSGLPQAEDPFLGGDLIYLRKDGKAISRPLGISGGSKLPTRYPYDIVEGGTEASKVELLRAMDVRLLALRQEQSTAFGRAAAAGFNHGNMTDLMTFSEYFGADRLRVACANFLLVSERRVVEPTKLNLQAMASGCDVSFPNPNLLEGLPQVSAGLSQDDQAHMPNGRNYSEDERAQTKDALLPAQVEETGFDGSLSKGTSGILARKRWGPSTNVRPESSGDHNQVGSEQSKTFGNQLDLLPSKQMSNITKLNASHVQEHDKDIISAPTRRLSVQDAISLFEEKKKQESIRAPEKQFLGKEESGRVSMEGTNTTSGSIALRRWTAVNGGEVDEVSQGSEESRKGKGDVFLPRQDMRVVEPAADSAFPQFCPTMKLNETFGKVSATKEENVGATLQDPIHIKLEKSTARATLARDLTVKQSLAKCESTSIKTRTDNFLNSDSGDRVHPIKPEMTDSRSREQEKVSLSTGLQKPMSMQDGSISHNCSLEVDAIQIDLRISTTSSDIKQANMIKEERRKDAGTKIFVNSEVATNRESFGSSRVDSFHYDIQDHVSIFENQASVDVEDLSEHRSRFYEQYTKLRDAKLMEEKDTRRAQREAKLRVMEETLCLRKAELDAQAMRQSKINHQHARAAKLQARKTDFYILQKEKDDGVGERYGEISSYSNGHSVSPPLTPFAGKEHDSTSKSQSGRKPAAGSIKGATPPRSSIRGTSVSPKLAPRSATGSTSKPRKSSASNVTEIPLVKSVPPFANLRKENTKPSAGRPSGNAGLQVKDGGSGRFHAVSEAHPLEANVNALVCTLPPGNGPTKEDKVRGSSLVRKNYADVKILSTSSDDIVMAPLCKVQREVESEATALSKSKRNGASCFHEDMHSAEKGSHSGPVRLLGMIQQSPLPTVKATFDSNEERAPISRFLESNTADGNNRIPEEYPGLISQRDANELKNMSNHVIDEANTLPDPGSANFSVLQRIASADGSGDQGLQLIIQGVTERARHTKCFPIDIAAASPLKANLREDLECYPQSQFPDGTGDGLASQFRDGSGDGLLSCYVANGSTSFCGSSLPHELQLPVLLHGSAPPHNSRVVQAGEVSGHFNPLPIDTLGSPLESLANWKSSQIHCASEAEISQLNKKWIGSQKLVSTKEPARGFKRLLKFARKNRTLDAASADWVSTSEGDDELEDQRLSTDDPNAKGRLEERIVFEISGEQKTTSDQISATQSLRSSIPAPPTNFRLRDDHLMGGTMLKAPKSFFSLSSFRNKGMEGKAR